MMVQYSFFMEQIEMALPVVELAETLMIEVGR